MPTQFEMGPYGARICTPVSLLIACQYLLRHALTPEVVLQCMRSAHSLYAEHFGTSKEPLPMVEEFLHVLPPTLYRATAVAGPTCFTETLVEVEDMQLLPLPQLLLKLRGGSSRVAAVLTMQGHTRCFMFDGQDDATLFDPAVGLACQLGELHPKPGEYSGVLLSLR
jgi:hypothetical protein